MRILVTGATGYIGGRLVGRLLSDLFLTVEDLLKVLRVLQRNRRVTGQLAQANFIFLSEVASFLINHLEGA